MLAFIWSYEVKMFDVNLETKAEQIVEDRQEEAKYF